MNSRDRETPIASEQALHARIAQLEAELAERHGASAFLESVLAAVPTYVMHLDPELKIRFLNRYQPGHSPESVLGTDAVDYLAEEDRERVRGHIERARSTGQITSFTVQRAVGGKGALASYLTRVAPVREPDGRTGVCLSFVDVTEEARRQRTFEETEEKLKLALDATGLGLWTWDLKTGKAFWDERLCALYGRSEPPPVERYGELCVHPEDRQRVERTIVTAIGTGVLPENVFRIVRPDGTVRWVLALGRTICDAQGNVQTLVGGKLDVTRQHEIAEQLRKTQKMEALACLTAGVAHNFNNMLSVIAPALELGMPFVPVDQQPLLEGALQAVQRAAELVRQLMTYVGQGGSDRRVSADVNGLVSAAVGICRRALGPQIELALEPLPSVQSVECVPGQIEQVLVNLLFNARDAVQATPAGRGKVTVRVRRGSLPADASRGQAARPCVCVDVIDSGAGLTDQARAHLFEPFFTTNGPGKGTGLGLATSHAIAREHDGTLSCEAAGPRGTQFTLALPVAGV